MARFLLAEILTRKKMSKRQFAIRLGIKYENVFRFFHRGYDPKLSMLERWAKVLKVRIRDLIKE